MGESSLERRHFLQGVGAVAALLMSQRGLRAQDVVSDMPPMEPPIGIGVVGLGPWGREILSTLVPLPFAKVVAVCDTYAVAVKKALEVVPDANGCAAVDELLAVPGIEAVVVATPTHRHREVVEAALTAGKHVYCEAPLAASLDEARQVGLAGKNAQGLIFQTGLQGRSNALYRHVSQFVKSGVMGRNAMVAARWSARDSWRRTAPTDAREAELNWRLDPASSPGIVGEVGLHHLDLALDYMAADPVAVTGFGGVTAWSDGRKVPDTVQCVLELPKGIQIVFMATLASSAGSSYVLFQGDNASLMMMEKRGWLIKEADSPLLGWEVYARKEPLLADTGIAMVADSTKILEAGKEPGQEGPEEPERSALSLALQSFCSSIRLETPNVCDAEAGYRATAVALLCNQAIVARSRVAIDPARLALA